MKKKTFSISIPENMYKQIKKSSDKLGISMSAYIILVLKGEQKL